MFKKLYRRIKNRLTRFAKNGDVEFSSAEYWEDRYKSNGNSGAGSYNHLAAFKADILNSFVKEHRIQSVVEFGCGDGNQLMLADYPKYIGFDVSPKSIQICKKLFSDHPNWSFHLTSEGMHTNADLAMSLDVIYHLVEDDIYHNYMRILFESSMRWVIIYSSNTIENSENQSIHVRHRKFEDWIDSNQPTYQLWKCITNIYPIASYGEKGSFADFYIYKKRD